MRRICSNLHTHTVFSDGTSTAEEYVQAAIKKGFVSLGFSEHAFAPYDSGSCIKAEDVPLYYWEINRLREKYNGTIKLYIGWENDYFHPWDRENVDFLIGSAHYVRDEKTGKYYTIDYLPAIFEEARDIAAGGNIRTLIERYFAMVMDIALRQKPDIIGHMDLIAKLNKDGRYFEVSSGWYQSIIGQTVRAVAASGCIVEINTGGMFRGYTDTPYPSKQILEQLYSADVPITISSDAHSAEGLDYQFEEMAQLAQDIGYTSTKQLIDGRFVDVALYQ